MTDSQIQSRVVVLKHHENHVEGVLKQIAKKQNKYKQLLQEHWMRRKGRRD